MRRGAFFLLGMLFVLAAAEVVSAQPKDPFRPPATAGSQTLDDPGGAQAPRVVTPPDAAGPGDGLARTGQDVGTRFAAGFGLIACGLALRFVAQAAYPGVRRRARRFRGPPRVVRPQFPYA